MGILLGSPQVDGVGRAVGGGYVDPSTIALTNPPTLTPAMHQFIAEETTWDEVRAAPMIVNECRIRVE